MGVQAQKVWDGSYNQKEKEKLLVRFFPNPAINFINFEFREMPPSGSSLQIYSFLGRQVAIAPVNARRITVNVSELFRGLYVFQIITPSGKIFETNKFQVSH
jgi:hypothetical protein